MFGQVNPWPRVEPLRVVHTFLHADSNSDLPFLTFIRNSAGVPIYKFECHNGNYDDESEMNFSGTFQCALFGIKGNTLTTTNLLAADTSNELSTDWWNRGRMLSTQLRGKCLGYPEYSADRHFRLRGMLLTMRFTHAQWGTDKNGQGGAAITKFTFTLDVVPDRSALSSRAELPAGPKPPASCYP
ncbi:MAG TPA: hypothetical protein VNJ52_02580 [Patescibacteria group bacterium]|nr:hypothetical protein [Patescibacteria group bacterium]